MKCKDCFACRKGYFESKPQAYVCIGVKEPFVIYDINVECTEYPEKSSTFIEYLYEQETKDIENVIKTLDSILQRRHKNGQSN